MKAIEQYYCGTDYYGIQARFIMLYIVVLTFKSVDKTLVCDHSNEMKTELYFNTQSPKEYY